MIKDLIWMIICHVVGDYLLQTDYMASQKGKDWYLLFVHCVCYILPFIIVFGMVWQIAVMFAVHFVTDAAKARYHKINLLCDQAIHYAIALLILI